MGLISWWPYKGLFFMPLRMGRFLLFLGIRIAFRLPLMPIAGILLLEIQTGFDFYEAFP